MLRQRARGCRILLAAGAAFLLAGCGERLSAYETGVADYEPVYCYQSLAGVTCYSQPHERDNRRLTNFYGPPPRTYPPAVEDDDSE